MAALTATTVVPILIGAAVLAVTWTALALCRAAAVDNPPPPHPAGRSLADDLLDPQPGPTDDLPAGVPEDECPDDNLDAEFGALNAAYRLTGNQRISDQQQAILDVAYPWHRSVAVYRGPLRRGAR